ncbi:MAG: Holliday junction resolvase RuvX [Actinomycetota bacterium]
MTRDQSGGRRRRFLGVDLGSVRVGLAVSDPLGMLAQPLDVVSLEDAASAIAERIAELEVDEIIVGMPLNMDGSHGPAADAATAFADELRASTNLPVSCFDERLSTVEAERAMRSAGTSSKGQRGKVDKVAAALVLQAYLDSRRIR